MKYIESYLKEFANKYSKNTELYCKHITEGNKSYPIFFTLSDLLSEASNEITNLKKELKELQDIKTIIEIAKKD